MNDVVQAALVDGDEDSNEYALTVGNTCPRRNFTCLFFSPKTTACSFLFAESGMLHGLVLATACVFPYFGCINISFCKANNLPSSPIIPDYSHRTKGPLLVSRRAVPTMSDNSSAKSLADPALLETIDKLFQHNIGDYVSLPQVSL